MAKSALSYLTSAEYEKDRIWGS